MSNLQTYAERYHASPTPLHREAAVLAGVPLVRSIAGKVPVPDSPLACREDLEGAGLVALVEALDSYDPSVGAKFMTYAYLRVRGAIVDYLRKLDVLSLDKRRRMAEAGRVAEALRQERGAEPPDRDIAARMGISVADYDRLLVEAQARFALSFDAPAYDDGGSLHETIGDTDDRFAGADRDHTLALARSVIENLPQRTRAMVAMYYDEGLTLRQIGQVFEVSEARVSQILGKTMLTIRAQLEQEPADAPATPSPTPTLIIRTPPASTDAPSRPAARREVSVGPLL
ncbi:sigma-70 family RNA polymerase sigma factor [Rubrivirga sp. IMCC45206]|uniref:sigma-70 family RNA polymerase sigma factor n=1 Tax=Rubrivirga sp. IMCC45206 TaxID=3391614 RepID=UPI00398FD449